MASLSPMDHKMTATDMTSFILLVSKPSVAKVLYVISAIHRNASKTAAFYVLPCWSSGFELYDIFIHLYTLYLIYS